MAHEDAGHYAAKHKGAKLNEKIAEKVREKMSNATLSCGAAHVIAEELGVAASEVGFQRSLFDCHQVVEVWLWW